MRRQSVATPTLLDLEEDVRRQRQVDAARWRHFLQLAFETEQVGRTDAFLEELGCRSGISNGDKGLADTR